MISFSIAIYVTPIILLDKKGMGKNALLHHILYRLVTPSLKYGKIVFYFLFN